jgi:RNA polymerase-binding transcription factor DksA
MSTDAAIQGLRAQLEGEREELRRQLSEIGYGAEGPVYDANFADSSQVTAERGEAEALANTLLESLREVEHALAKFDAGDYGLCESCRQPIAEARLEAMPAARYCINCASTRR